ncbi:MAG: DUF3368 domain-containing protein [Coriobacteriia bacterium]|nr:DUF3368 domain-containing protein [Coriobacteriia bacterium]
MPEARPGPVVSNSGPLIALACIGQLDLLGRIYGESLVPGAVFREVVEIGAGRPGASELRAAGWAKRVEVVEMAEPLLAEELGRGETEAITLATRAGARLVLMDDRRARRIAELAYRLRVKGVAGVLLQAKRARLVSAVRPLAHALRANGYRLSDRLIEALCREAGE